MIDYSRIGGGRRAKLLNPRDIFTSLPHKPWPRLRIEQGEVLKAWFERRAQRDIVIKQNTGGGKTVTGLLIAQSSLNEGVGRAVYLVPDTYLAAQVLAEAARLGIEAVDNIRDERFLASEAVLVTTFQKLVNGRSSFGVNGSSKAVVDLGVVVVDDAHAALAIAEQQFSISIPALSPAYDKLLTLFEPAIRQQSEAAWLAISERTPTAPVAIPYWDWQNHLADVRRVLAPHAADDDDKWIFYAWPATSQILDYCVATVTPSEIELRPICVPIDLIPSFANAARRVYLTATLADDSILVTEFGADPAQVATPITPARAADLGDRVILAPLSLNPSLDESAVRKLAHEFSRGDRDGTGRSAAQPINVVVLVPSDARAELWAGYADATCHVRDMQPVIDRLKAGEHVGVVVLVNKYDGVDLPGDACRLLVIDGVPFPLSPGEAREAGGLAGTKVFEARQVQRIEQGMGRGIRDAEDYCAVVLMGPELAVTLRDKSMQKYYSPATRAQIELSQDVAEQLRNQGLKPLRDMVSSFLERETDWLTASSEAIAGITYDADGHVTPLAIARRRAFDLARAAQPYEAAQAVLDALPGLSDNREAGWYAEEAARYQFAVDKDAAQKTLREARLRNNRVLLPLTASPVKPLRPAAEQAIVASQFLASTYSTAVELQLGLAALLNDIAFDASRVDAAERAVEQLGFHLGFESDRPDKIYGTGPDVLWSVRDDLQLVIELKSGVTRPDSRISKSELDQSSGHLNWHAKHYGATTTGVPIIIHPESTYLKNGTPSPGTLVLTAAGIDDLKQRVSAFASAIGVNDGWRDPAKVKEALASQSLLGRESLTKSAVKPTSE